MELENKELNDKMQKKINKSIQKVKDWMSCRDKGCVCMEDDYDTIEYNMSLGWSLEISEALLGEDKYMETK